MADETISEKCETLYNKLNTFVASVISRDVTPKLSNLNTEVWGSDTQTGSSRIDTLNTNFDNLNNSITTIESNTSIVNIECSDYNPSIDGNITVTITVTDVYGDAISGESVTVTASEGNFTQLNGSNITNASSVTGTTNSSGQFTLTYTCSEWGLATFSANNRSTQVNVTGWKEVWANTTSNPKIQVFRNADHCRLKFTGYTVSSMSTTWVQYGSTAFLNDWKPSQVVAFIGSDYTFLLRITEDGKLYWRTVTGTLSNKNIYGQFEWSIA